MIIAEYTVHEKFEIPEDLDLEDTSVVEFWGVKWNTLYVRFKNGKEIEIQPVGWTNDPDYKCPDKVEIKDDDDERDESEDDYEGKIMRDDKGVLCVYSEENGWEALEDACEECGYRCEECECKKKKCKKTRKPKKEKKPKKPEAIITTVGMDEPKKEKKRKVMKWQLDSEGNKIGEGVPVPNTFCPLPNPQNIGKRSAFDFKDGVWTLEKEVDSEEEDYEYIIKTWDKNGEYDGLFEVDCVKSWTEEDKAREIFKLVVETGKMGAVELIRIDDNSNEDRETIISSSRL